jgi:hypothetical protein
MTRKPVPFHLPALPNVGYATQRERAMSDCIMQFLREIERDRPRLLTIVVEGREKWRRVAGSVWRGYRIGEDDGAINAIYDYLTLLACPPPVQYRLLQTPKNKLKWNEVLRQAWPGIEQEREHLKALNGQR